MKSKMFFKALFVLGIALSLSGCKKDKTSFSWNNETGLFIVHEGAYKGGNASVSFYNTSSNTVVNDLYTQVNGLPLGDVAQSMSAYNGKYYIVVNNSNKVEIVNKSDFVSAGTISGLGQPRYFLGIDSTKAYVSQWGTDGMGGEIAIINLKTNTLTGTITTGYGAENMLKVDNLVYVANSGGNLSDSTISVINTTTDQVVTKIKVGYNPNSLAIDKNHKIWVLCGGLWKTDYTGLANPGALVRLNPATNQVELTLNFTSLIGGYDKSTLSINQSKDALYYTLDGMLYEQKIDETSLSASAKISRSFYNIALDPQTGIFYAADTQNFTASSWVIRYNNTYAKVDSFKVGIAPSYMFFNE